MQRIGSSYYAGSVFESLRDGRTHSRKLFRTWGITGKTDVMCSSTWIKSSDVFFIRIEKTKNTRARADARDVSDLKIWEFSYPFTSRETFDFVSIICITCTISSTCTICIVSIIVVGENCPEGPRALNRHAIPYGPFLSQKIFWIWEVCLKLGLREDSYRTFLSTYATRAPSWVWQTATQYLCVTWNTKNTNSKNKRKMNFWLIRNSFFNGNFEFFKSPCFVP